jgi:uncharacterized protein YceK
VVGGDIEMRLFILSLFLAGVLAGCSSVGGSCSGSYDVCVTRHLNSETSNAVRGLDNE